MPRPALLLFALVLFALLGAATARAQTARLNGFITDATDGAPLELVNVALDDLQGGLQGTVTSRDGLYQITRLAPGRYVLRVSFVGYETASDTLQLAPGEVRTVNLALTPDATALGEVVVQTERDDGAARVTAGQQTIRPEEIALIPTADLSGDLAGYLGTVPGIVSTGDRGGQLFIRGGEPSQNLVLLDGMLLYQPFHVVGSYSAFPADILSRTDLYAGGYGAKFGERISSVIDVWTREGNKRRFAGNVSLSPFVSAALVEGPILPGHVSFLASVRRSVIEEGAERIVGRPLPFRFGDAFGKLHAALGPRSRLSVSALQTHDRGTLHEATGLTPPEEVRWQNQAASLRLVMLPRALSVATELRLSYARLSGALGPPDAPHRRTAISNLQLALDASFPGERVNVDAGGALRLISPSAELGGLYQNVESQARGIDHFALYLEPEVRWGALRVRPGARLEFFAARLDPVLEPRLRVVWTRGHHQVSAATGVYHQEVVGLVDQRDAASVFTAWTGIPAYEKGSDAGGIPRAVHAILGYRATPTPWLEASVEGFYKDLDDLYVAEWTPYPRMTTRLQSASGNAVGFDTRVELRRAPFYAFVNYGLSATRYTARQATLPLWFGEDALTYRPAHDRRHQVNAVLNTRAAGFDLSVRWEFGSGLPFSRPAGFDGFVPIADVRVGPDAPRYRRALYGRPFNAELPTYHRLDLSVERTVTWRRARLTVLGSLLNLYDRRNLFYVDVFTLRRVDQLPLVPSVGLKVAFGGDAP